MIMQISELRHSSWKKLSKKHLGDSNYHKSSQKLPVSQSRYESTGKLSIIAPNLIPTLIKANLYLKIKTILIFLLPDLDNLDFNFVPPPFSFHPCHFVTLIQNYCWDPKKIKINIWISYQNLYIVLNLSPFFKNTDKLFQLFGKTLQRNGIINFKRH